MNKSEAIEIIEKVQFCAQKNRSNISEFLEDYQVSEEIKGLLNPYLFPEYSKKEVDILRQTEILLEHKEFLTPMNLWNLLFIVEKEAGVTLMLLLQHDIDVQNLLENRYKWMGMEFENEET